MSEHILQQIDQHQVIILSGETGSGKSTQVPQYILEAGIRTLKPTNIVCTQPRRISAVSLASRVGDEMSDPANFGTGALVGYQVRMESRVSQSTRLTFCTTGILLRRLESDPQLANVTHVVVDEVHERTVESDFLVYLLRRLVTRRPDLRVVLMSATADAAHFAAFFEKDVGETVPHVVVPGKTFPVSTNYLEDIVESTGYVLENSSEYCARYDGHYKGIYNLQRTEDQRNWKGWKKVPDDSTMGGAGVQTEL
jgi:ATP-dependent RNA helicase DHX29